ncbi:MAG TPA: helix-turn-helix domain-containing protein [Tepidisphaeraceae bacterium]|jgi:hypothetical protein
MGHLYTKRLTDKSGKIAYLVSSDQPIPDDLRIEVESASPPDLSNGLNPFVIFPSEHPIEVIPVYNAAGKLVWLSCFENGTKLWPEGLCEDGYVWKGKKAKLTPEPLGLLEILMRAPLDPKTGNQRVPIEEINDYWMEVGRKDSGGAIRQVLGRIRKKLRGIGYPNKIDTESEQWITLVRPSRPGPHFTLEKDPA